MMMHRATATTIALVCCLVAGGGARAQPFDYPAARLATTWANTDAALPHHVVYTDGSVARAALLRLNPAGLGPSYAFGFFCTASQPRGDGPAAPCTEFLLGVAVVYCNSGAGMTFVTAGVPQVVWSANRGSPVRDGAAAELTVDGDLVLTSSTNGAVVWSAGAKGRSVARARIGSDGNLVLFDGRNDTVWQSFDHPTNALLVGQSLKHGARLTANASTADWRDGRLFLAVGNDGLSAYVNATPPQRYYHLGLSEAAPGAYATYTNGSLTVSARSSRCAASGCHPAAHRRRRHGALHAAGARRPPPALRVAVGLGAGVRRAAPLPGRRVRISDSVRRVRRVHGRHAVQLPRRGQLPGGGLPEAQPRLRPDESTADGVRLLVVAGAARAAPAGVAAGHGLLQRPRHEHAGRGAGGRGGVQEGVPGRLRVRGGAVLLRPQRRRRVLLPAVGGVLDADGAARGGALQLHHAHQGAGRVSQDLMTPEH